MNHFLAWCRQTTTVQGFAVLVLTAVLQLTQTAPTGVVVATAATSLVLLILPGQGDLAGRIGAVARDLENVASSRGSSESIGALARDGLVLAGTLPPGASVIPVVTFSPASVARTGMTGAAP